MLSSTTALICIVAVLLYIRTTVSVGLDSHSFIFTNISLNSLYKYLSLLKDSLFTFYLRYPIYSTLFIYKSLLDLELT